jgi:hypothetical protein
MFRIIVGLMALLAASSPGLAQQQKVDVEIVFLADASLSIDHAEIKFQRSGHATAIQDPDVLAAIARGIRGRIAISFMEWADEHSQAVVVPWTLIDGARSAKAFAQALMAAPRTSFGMNAIGSALAAGHATLLNNQFDGFRKVIDFAGDSANSYSGVPIAVARAAALKAGITINGLAIACRADNCSGQPVTYDLKTAFAQRIIGGPGSFVVSVDSRAGFADAVRKKLILELAAAPGR